MEKLLEKLSKFSRRARFVLLLDVLASVFSSIFVLLLVRWQVKVIPDFQLLFLGMMLLSLAAALVSDLIVGTQKIIVRYASIRSVSKLMEAILMKEVILGALMLLGLICLPETTLCIIFLIFDFALTLLLRVLIRVCIVFIYENVEDDMEVNVGLFNVIVYGISDKSVAMVMRLEQSLHYNVLGFLSPEKSDAGMILMDHKVYWAGDLDSFSELKMKLGIQGVLFSREDEARKEKDGVVSMALQCGVHILSTPRIEDAGLEGVTSEAMKNVIESDYIPDGMSAFERQFKRICDLLLSAVLIVLFSPLMLICAIAVKCKGGEGPVLFKQERIGRFGRPFMIYKFRTMFQDSEPDGAQLYAGDDDPRLTKVGHFLRVHHLDELPQLFNVFCGDMAFVGYRPERKYYIDQIAKRDHRYYFLYQIRPGVTSYATLKNGYADSLDKMLRRMEFDLYYLRNRSAWFDIKVLWQTFVNIIFGKKF